MMDSTTSQRFAVRTDEILRSRQRRIYRRIDRMFATLMIVQWIGTVGIAVCVDKSWLRPLAEVHAHVKMAFVLGGFLAGPAVWLAWRRPGATVTRYVVVVSQVLFSSLLVQVSGGSLETHFHIFGSLAFLAAYRDWKALITATCLEAIVHFLQETYWPEAIFGAGATDQWRWIEHTGWILFEDLFLLITIRKSTEEMRNNALQTAQLEDHHEELKRYAEQAQRSFDKVRSIVDSSLDAMIELDSRWKVTRWNNQAEQMLGWKLSEAAGRCLTDLAISFDHRGRYWNELKRLAKSSATSAPRERFELNGCRRGGQIFPAEIAIVPILECGESAFCVFIRDVADRKSHEAELRQAIENAEAANRTKSAFLANMSHEIRTPLNSILGFAELLARNADEGNEHVRQDYLQTIRTSARHLLELINNVLDLSKIEAGELRVELVKFSPHQIIAEVASLLRVRAAEKGIVLNYRWDGLIPETVTSDPYRIRQMLVNLVGNAIKFTEQGSVMIVAQVEQNADGSYLIIEVRDTGIGIDKTKLEDVFRPFVQADDSMTRRYGGTGLGLAICRNIAEALGGSLTVTSELGRGATFTARIGVGNLRNVRMLDVSPDSASGDYIDSRETAISLNDVRILLADDGETNRKLLQIFLSRHGADVQAVENGDRAWRKALMGGFDVVLMDMQMPIMDGYAAARKLRSLGFDRPIIALTAHAMKGDREKCIEAGCTSYLSKPINVDDLVREVKKVLASAAPQSAEVDSFSAIAAVGASDGKEEATATGWHGGTIRSSLPTDDDQLREIVSEFIGSISDRIDALEQALANEDFEELKQLSHALKGSGGTAGFSCLSEVSAKLETAVFGRHGPEAAELIAKLRAMEPHIVV